MSHRKGRPKSESEPVGVRLARRFAVNSMTGCWEWTARLDAAGYGRILVGSRANKTRRTRMAHRVAFEHFVRPLNAGELVLHRCDNRRCINPAHLFTGTQQDNMNDMVSKGRSCKTPRMRGESHTNSKLTEQDVVEIRSSYLTQRELSDKYGISRAYVSSIITGENWAHVAGARPPVPRGYGGKRERSVSVRVSMLPRRQAQ